MKLYVENRQLQIWKANLLGIGLLSLSCVVIWIGITIYANFNQSKIDPEMAALIKPINPTLDHEAVSNFATSRITLPEQFTITGVITDNQTSTTVTINPF